MYRGQHTMFYWFQCDCDGVWLLNVGKIEDVTPLSCIRMILCSAFLVCQEPTPKSELWVTLGFLITLGRVNIWRCWGFVCFKDILCDKDYRWRRKVCWPFVQPLFIRRSCCCVSIRVDVVNTHTHTLKHTHTHTPCICKEPMKEEPRNICTHCFNQSL